MRTASATSSECRRGSCSDSWPSTTVASPEVRWIGIDPIEPMVEKARTHCHGQENIELLVGDAVEFEYEKADLFLSYYCIQFIPPRYRQELIDRIYERLNWARFDHVREGQRTDARFQDIMVSLYNDFKVKNGFTADEILNKTSSLKGVWNRSRPRATWDCCGGRGSSTSQAS